MSRRWAAAPLRPCLRSALPAAAAPTGSARSIGNKDADSADQTGSIAQSPIDSRRLRRQPIASRPKPISPMRAPPPPRCSTRGGKDTSVPWENPQTGARGNITPLASAYNQDGFTCRDFLASYVREGAEAWLQGEACRMAQGKWEVRR